MLIINKSGFKTNYSEIKFIPLKIAKTIKKSVLKSSLSTILSCVEER
jgi:hypothetical protein